MRGKNARKRAEKHLPPPTEAQVAEIDAAYEVAHAAYLAYWDRPILDKIDGHWMSHTIHDGSIEQYNAYYSASLYYRSLLLLYYGPDSIKHAKPFGPEPPRQDGRKSTQELTQ